jgi:2-amino-4-hydroxy-6-hydroxymethyldihydropteridine diphosphokinase
LSEPAFLLLGSNLDPQENLRQAIPRLAQLGRLARLSSVYQSPPSARPEQPDFLNLAALVWTDLPATQLRAALRQIEAAQGRVRSADKHAPRTLDIDLCLLGSLILETPSWRVPDPDLLIQPHVAIPVAELWPDFPHPETGESLRLVAQRLRKSAPLTPRPKLSQELRRLAGHIPAASEGT